MCRLVFAEIAAKYCRQQQLLMARQTQTKNNDSYIGSVRVLVFPLFVVAHGNVAGMGSLLLSSCMRTGNLCVCDTTNVLTRFLL